MGRPDFGRIEGTARKQRHAALLLAHLDFQTLGHPWFESKFKSNKKKIISLELIFVQKSTSSDLCPQNSSTEITLKEVTSNNAQISQLLRRLKEDALNVECYNGC